MCNDRLNNDMWHPLTEGLTVNREIGSYTGMSLKLKGHLMVGQSRLNGRARRAPAQGADPLGAHFYWGKKINKIKIKTTVTNNILQIPPNIS